MHKWYRLGLLLTILTPWATCPAGAEEPPPPGAEPDSAFVANQARTEEILNAEGPRKDWIRRKDTLQFGAYGFEYDQQIDPKTGLPTQQNPRWEDYCIRFVGKRTQFYMASNWGQRDFMGVAIRLQGDKQDLPDPLRFQVASYLILREVTPTRILAEGAWPDGAGGSLRLRFTGWKGADRCGLTLRYFPPPGRTVEKISYWFTTNPYETSDRGEWGRKRWFATPIRDAEVSKDDTPLNLEQEWLLSCYNRFGMEGAGTVLALDRQSVGTATLKSNGTIYITVTPKTPDGDLRLILGDWVYLANPIVTADFFATQHELLTAFTELATQGTPPLPPFDAAYDAETTKLLDTYPELAEQFRADLAAARVVEQAARPLATTQDTVAAFTRWYTADTRKTALYRAIRSTWYRKQLWGKTP